MKKLRWIFAVIIALFYSNNANAESLAEILGGESNIEIIKSAEKVEAFRIAVSYGEEVQANLEQLNKMDTFPILAGPKEVNSEGIKSWSGYLLNQENYNEAYYLCAFSPVFALRFVYKEESLDSLVCFGCQEVQFWKDGKMVGESFMTKNLNEMLKGALNIFPNEEVFKAVKLK